nr:MAG TPA: hypothetical protein [Bacteriophage sp.]DAV61400.1 MAG TPA: hypothetical protein [Caudoviricetes sp.]
MNRKKDLRRDAAHRLAGYGPEYPPELCRRCVWASGQGDRKLCPFPRCVVRSGDMRLKP